MRTTGAGGLTAAAGGGVLVLSWASATEGTLRTRPAVARTAPAPLRTRRQTEFVTVWGWVMVLVSRVAAGFLRRVGWYLPLGCRGVRRAGGLLGWGGRGFQGLSSGSARRGSGDVTIDTRMPPTEAPQRILLIRPSALGDVCRSVPLLASLRAGFPQARIDWLVQDTFVDAVAHHPAFGVAGSGAGGVVAFPRRRFARWTSPAVTGEVVRWMRGLRRTRYDMVIDAQGLARSGVFTFATGAPTRVGYADAPEGAWLGYTIRADAPKTLHTVDRMMRLLTPLAVPPVMDMKLYPAPEEVEKVRADPMLAGKRFCVIAATSRWAGKQWSADRFALVTERLVSDPVYRMDAAVIVGSKGEREQIGSLLGLVGRERKVIDRVGATSIGGLMALVQASSLVVANDSAALHMAVAFERPLVALFGPTRVDLVGPYGRSRDVLQHVTASDKLDHKNAAVGKLLMDRITVAEVLARAQGAVAGERGTAGTR